MDILKARFGEKISSSNSCVLPPWHDVYKKYDGKSIKENLPSDIFKECVDLEYTQIKIIELIEAKMCIGEYEQNVTTIGEIEIKELRFSRHTFNCLCVNGIFTVQDLVARTEEELLKIRHFGKNSFDEVLKKVQSLGIQMKDGHFDNSNLNNVLESEVANNLEKVKEIEKLINSSEYISEEKKKELKKMLYKPLNITIDEDKDLEERSKEELIEHLLEQQKTIAEQCEEIDELSSKKMEEV